MAGSSSSGSLVVALRAAEGLWLLILAGVFLAAGSCLKRAKTGGTLKTTRISRPPLKTG